MATPIRLLPASLFAAELPDEFDEPVRVPIRLRQDTMEPAFIDSPAAISIFSSPAIPGRARVIRRAEPARLIHIAQAT